MIINSKVIAIGVSCLCFFVFACPHGAKAIVFHDISSLLKEQFRSSEKIAYERVKLSPQEQQVLQQRIRHRLAKQEYVIFVASTRGKVDGYALIDDERGQHEPITFAAFFDAQGHVIRQEVVAYREPYGDAIRQERFRKQFYGRSATSGFELGKDIDSVSGATISAGAMCAGVRRATLLVDILRQRVARKSSVASL